MELHKEPPSEDEITITKVLAVVCGIVAAFSAYLVLTVPLIAATAPVILMLAAGVGAVLLWKNAEKKERERAEIRRAIKEKYRGKVSR